MRRRRRNDVVVRVKFRVRKNLVAGVHVMINRRRVEGCVGELLNRRGVGRVFRPFHRDEVNALQPGFDAKVAADLERLREAFARFQLDAVFLRFRDHIGVDNRRVPNDDDRFAVDLVIFRRLKIILEPKLRNRAPIGFGVRSGAVVIRPHNRPF